jgi:release factor glutamine methyltransferase
MVANRVGMATVGETLKQINPRLRKISDTADQDGQFLLARVLERSRAWVLAHPEIPLPGKLSNELETLVKRMEKGEPLPYILGSWEFYGLDFIVSPDVIIPRPETELLVERALTWLSMDSKKQHLVDGDEPARLNPTRRVLDLGTGSGCIAIALAVNQPCLDITAIDVSSIALKIACRNAERNSVLKSVRFMKSDLFSNLSISDQFHLIITNPPYIPTKVLKKLPVYRQEPPLALDGGMDGLTLIRRFLVEAPARLIPGGLLLMEIEASEGRSVQQLAFQAFPDASIKLHRDLAGHERMLEIQT